MKRIVYLFCIIISLTSCEKVLLERKYDRKIQGSWHIQSITLAGNNNTYGMSIRGGDLTFNSDNTMKYVDLENQVYTGEWILYSMKEPWDCFEATPGTTYCNNNYNVIVNVDVKNSGGERKRVHFKYLELRKNGTLKAEVLGDNAIIWHIYNFVRK
ncbi:hypothetical protein ACQ33O_11295 [Ferruginibacter sp. SUN002]|uniref:hypothetical protein n=1 Tax=Ferruginibacter sp. SUN002 TaxID=2937789 RepID=UPI003D3627A8